MCVRVCDAGMTLLSALIELANGVNYVLDNTQVRGQFSFLVKA